MNVTAGTYTLCVSDDNSCMQCDTFTVLAPGTGISNFNDVDGVSVYPNPFSSSLIIRLQNETSIGTTLKIYSSIGELVYLNHFYGLEFRMNPSELSEGLYFLQIDSSNKMLPVLLQK